MFAYKIVTIENNSYKNIRKGWVKMINVFRKLIQREFGHPQYYRFFSFLRDKLQDGKIEAISNKDESKICNDDIYQEMYNILKDEDTMVLRTKQQRLSDAMLNAMGICKSYFIVMLIYFVAIATMGVLIGNEAVFYLGVGVLTCVYIYKTYEFISNKYCFIDAYIVVIYKCVLDKLLSSCSELNK